MLEIAKNLKLPLEAATETFALIGRRGSGKTNAACVLVEELLDNHVQVVVIDPVSVWHGLKSNKSGNGPGFAITVLGGEHADLPLNETSGAVVADFLVEHQISCVLDTSLMSKAAQRRFIADLCEQLYKRKALDKYKTPLHLVIEEADCFAPQRLFAGDERMFGSVDALVRRGRSRGVGVTLISQRPQVINKDVLSQVEVLACLQLNSPQDRKAVDAWVEAHDIKGVRKEFMDSLAGLERGEAWFWSPGLLDIFKRVHVRARHTFDSSATPKVGEKRVEPKKLAKIDIEKLRKAMGDTVKQIEDNDPSKLKARIRQLEHDIQHAHHEASSLHVDSDVAEKIRIKSYDEGVAGGYGQGFKEARKIATEAVHAQINSIGLILKDMQRNIRLVEPPADAPCRRNGPAGLTPKQAEKAYADAKPVPLSKKRISEIVTYAVGGGTAGAPPQSGILAMRITPKNNGDLDGPMHRIIDGMRWLESLGMTEHEESAVAFMAGYRVGGGAFNNPKGRLNKLGYIRYLGNGRMELTDEGRRHAAEPAKTLSVDELHRKVFDRLDGPEQRILTVLIGAYPQSLPNDVLAGEAGYRVGGAFNNPKGRLKSLGLIEYPEKSMVKASKVLFPEGLS